jgi:hypothetical protein
MRDGSGSRFVGRRPGSRLLSIALAFPPASAVMIARLSSVQPGEPSRDRRWRRMARRRRGQFPQPKKENGQWKIRYYTDQAQADGDIRRVRKTKCLGHVTDAPHRGSQRSIALRATHQRHRTRGRVLASHPGGPHRSVPSDDRTEHEVLYAGELRVGVCSANPRVRALASCGLVESRRPRLPDGSEQEPGP